MSRRLVVVMAQCRGHGICSLIAPKFIALDRWGYPIVDPLPMEGRASILAAERAVAACPRRALFIQECKE